MRSTFSSVHHQPEHGPYEHHEIPEELRRAEARGPEATGDEARPAPGEDRERAQRVHGVRADDEVEERAHLARAERESLVEQARPLGALEHDLQRPYMAVGDTLHVATRLQHQAPPDTIVVSATTYRLVQDEVQGKAREALTPEIPSTPVDVYALCGLRRRRAGVLRRDARPLSRFVGRTQELALLGYPRNAGQLSVGRVR